MEQDELLYEYKMGSEVFRFEARSHREAIDLRGYAIQYFAERAGPLFAEDAIIGPDRVEMPPTFDYLPPSRSGASFDAHLK